MSVSADDEVTFVRFSTVTVILANADPFLVHVPNNGYETGGIVHHTLVISIGSVEYIQTPSPLSTLALAFSCPLPSAHVYVYSVCVSGSIYVMFVTMQPPLMFTLAFI